MYHCEKADITPELHDDLIKLSLENLQHLPVNLRAYSGVNYCLFYFIPLFLSGLKELVWNCSLTQSLHTYLIYETAIF
jgi:hypothetical protein